MSEKPSIQTKEQIIKVLLVDDQRIIGEAIKRMLEPERDFVFRHCPDPAAAMQSVLDFMPTIILQDLVMPGVDGMSLLQSYKARPESKDIPVIVLSSEEDVEIKLKAFSLHASDYMVKVPHRIELVSRIREHAKARLCQLRLDEMNLRFEQQQAAIDLAIWLDALSLVASTIVRDLEAPIQYIVGNMIFVSDAFHSLTRFRARLARLPIPPDLEASMKEAADQEDLDFVFDDAPKAFRQSQVEMDRATSIISMLRSLPLLPEKCESSTFEVNAFLKCSALLLKERIASVAELKFDLAEGLPKISGRLSELYLAVLLVLISSAAGMEERYGKNGPKGLLEIKSSQEGKFLKLEFKDNGAPVDQDLPEKLSLSICPVVGKVSARRGLFVVKRIAESSGGAFEFSPCDSGSAVVLRLPVSI